MKKTFKVILGCLGLILLGIGVFLGILFYVFRSDEMCGNELLKTELSPNKEQKILVFARDCGATTGFSTQVSLVDASYILEKGDNGNVFSADSDHGRAEEDGILIKLKIKWIDNENILIEYPKHTRIFKNKTSIKGMKIKYKEI